MPTYEPTTEPESFYVDVVLPGQLVEITAVLRAVGGDLVYENEAYHLGEKRPRYYVTLPAGTIQSGLDEWLAPQSFRLPPGRSLTLWPETDRVRLSWLPGDCAESWRWELATRRPHCDQCNVPTDEPLQPKDIDGDELRLCPRCVARLGSDA